MTGSIPAGASSSAYVASGVLERVCQAHSTMWHASISDRLVTHRISCRKASKDNDAWLQASWGGGGKGIRRVNSEADVRLVFKQVAGEVPGSPVFTMRLAPPSRHLEVQTSTYSLYCRYYRHRLRMGKR